MIRTNFKRPQRQQCSSEPEWKWPAFLGLLIVQLWAAHACVFFAHEFAHSFMAWILGWKSNPLALNYAHPTLTVLLIQLGIDQNVDELPIFEVTTVRRLQSSALPGLWSAMRSSLTR